MDYLQQATERARREREGALGKTPEPGVQTLDVQRELGSRSERESVPSRTPDTSLQSERSDAERTPTEARGRKRGVVALADTPQDFLPDLPKPAEVRFTQTRRIAPDEATLRRNRVIAGDVDDQRVEVYRQLRSQVLNAMQRNQWKTLAITGAHTSAGKTLTALNLAIAISQEVNQTVMLVDLDLRTPNVHRTLGVEIEVGIVDHLQHGTPLEDVLINPDFPRLLVVPCLAQGHHASEILSSPEMKAFLKEITTRYPDRLIIFDLPPLLRNDDAMVFVPSADCCLLVVEDEVTTFEQLERSRKLLGHAELLGTVLNKARRVPESK